MREDHAGRIILEMATSIARIEAKVDYGNERLDDLAPRVRELEGRDHRRAGALWAMGCLVSALGIERVLHFIKGLHL